MCLTYILVTCLLFLLRKNNWMFTLLHKWLLKKLKSFPFWLFMSLLDLFSETWVQKASNLVLDWILFSTKESKLAINQASNTWFIENNHQQVAPNFYNESRMNSVAVLADTGSEYLLWAHISAFRLFPCVYLLSSRPS